jgi:hypothetical protein
VLPLAEWDGEADDERWLWNPVHEQLEDALEPVLAADPGGGAFYEEEYAA